MLLIPLKQNTTPPHILWPIIKKANIKNLRLAHTKENINLVANEVSLIKGKNTAYLSTGDTVISKNSNEVAKLAVGAGLT